MVDLNQKVKLVLEDLEVEVEEKKAIVTIETLPTIRGHRRQLQQLFQNLISNALKYSRPDVRPTVHISARRVKGNDVALPITHADSGKQYHLIEVRDNGIGFSQIDAERIFNVFTRLHGNAEYKGTGVGLSIVRKVVENHGGYIWAESKEDEGAIFKVLLPAE
jgi:signal transduction histidine kinase